MRSIIQKFLFSFSIGVILPCIMFGQTASSDAWVMNYRVNEVEYGGGQVFLQGEFDWLGPGLNSGIAVFDNNLGFDNSYPTLPYSVQNAVSDGAGGWYAVTYGVVTHIKADKTTELLPFEAEGGGYPISAIDKSGNILYIGGGFTSINGVSRNRLAAIDLTTNTLTGWNPGANGSVYDIKASGGVVYVGGSFSAAGGLTRSKIAAIDASTGVATGWNANVITGSGYVYRIVLGTGEVYFGGNFSNVASSAPSRRNFAAVNTTTGALITAINPRPNDNVSALLLDGSTLYIGGDYSQIGGIPKSSLAAIDVTTGALTAFNPILSDVNYQNNIYGLAVDGPKLFVGGDFLTINGAEQARLAAVDKITGATETVALETKIAGEVYVVLADAGVVFAGGYLAGVNGVSRQKGVAALDEDTGEATPWYPSHITDWIQDIHYHDNRVYYLTNEGNGFIGSVNTTDGAAIPGWDVTANDDITAWAFTDDVVYISGPFTVVNGESKENFAAIDLTTGDVLPWAVTYVPSYGDGEEITSMAVSGNVLYVGGDFGFIDNDIERDNLAAWDATTGDLLPWAPEVGLTNFQRVDIGQVHNSKVYLTGGVILRVDAITGEIDDDWRPDQPSEGGVSDIAIIGNAVFLAGQFSPGLLNIDITTGETGEWQPELDDVYFSEGSVFAVAASETKLFVGGNFSYQIGSEQRSYYAEYLLQPPSAMITSNLVTACEGLNSTIRVNVEGIIVTNPTYQWQKYNEVTTTFEDITDLTNYSGITSNRLTVVAAAASAGGDYRCHVAFDLGDMYSNVATLTVNAIPPAPSVTGGSACINTTLVLSATGGTDGQYRWYDVDTGGTALAETGSLFTTPELISTTSYYVSSDNGCESVRTEVIATVIETPAPGIINASGCSPSDLVLIATGGTAGNYRWYNVADGGEALSETDSEFTTGQMSETSSYYVSVIENGCESERTEAIATIINPAVPSVTNGSGCVSGSVTLLASGGEDGEYRWYHVAVGGEALDETNGQFITPALGASTSYYVSIVEQGCESARVEIAANILLPPLPSVTNASGCSSTSVTLTASGGTPGSYKWYEVPEGGVALAETNEQFSTPVLDETTSFFVAISEGGCESERVEVMAAITTTPPAPVVISATGCPSTSLILQATGGINGNYRWYEQPTGGVAIPGASGDQFSTPSLNASTSYFVSVINGTCESARTEVVATITGSCNNEPPAIETQQLTTSVGGSISLQLLSLITSTSFEVDINSLIVIVPPPSGATALITNGVLTIDYAGITFSGTETITIEACDTQGNCSQQQFEIQVAGDINVYNGISPNGANPILVIQNINLLPDTRSNVVIIFDRWQNEVWRGTDYDNSTVVFSGVNSRGGDLPAGTYYYKIEFAGGRKTATGFISLKR